MNIRTLEKIGLTSGEAKIYLALLKLGQKSSGSIVEESGVSTSKAYKILRRLEKKGLVGHVLKNNVMHWSAANPQRIVQMLEDQEKEITSRKEEAEKILPELLENISKAKEENQAEIYVGIKGMINVFGEETKYLKENKNAINYIIGSAKEYSQEIYNFFDRLESKKDSLRIKRKFILSIESKKMWPSIEKSKFCETRYIPNSSIVSMNLYGETSIISIFSKEPIFFVIRSKEITNSFKDHFELLWKIAK